MSYSPADFVDDVVGLIPISDEEIENTACDLFGSGDLSDDERFSAWAECALAKIRALTQPKGE